MLVIIGATATGKTQLAVNIAFAINGEIISADSRQVYKNMNIGTGKDLNEYIIEGENIPYHLIDIVPSGYEYSVYDYQQDFNKAYNDILSRDKIPILCGGSGMYIEAILSKYKLINVPENTTLRQKLKNLNDTELINILANLKSLHNTTDTKDRARLIRAIEIAEFYKQNPNITADEKENKINYKIFGIHFGRHILREKITERLLHRLNNGMIDEVDNLLKSGISPQKLIYYGLEYKFITQFLLNQITFDEMFFLLNNAIHQFAKRQETWFRRMERNGFKINWIDGTLPLTDKIKTIIKNY